MATVGYSFSEIGAATKALKIGDMKVCANGLSAEQIIARLSDVAILRQTVLVLEDAVAIDDGA